MSDDYIPYTGIDHNQWDFEEALKLAEQAGFTDITNVATNQCLTILVCLARKGYTKTPPEPVTPAQCTERIGELNWEIQNLTDKITGGPNGVCEIGPFGSRKLHD